MLGIWWPAWLWRLKKGDEVPKKDVYTHMGKKGIIVPDDEPNPLIKGSGRIVPIHEKILADIPAHR